MTISGLVGVAWPWDSGVPQFEYDEDVIYTAIKDIIFTTLGERTMNTKHGSEVIRLVFENKGPLMVALARREVTVALTQHLPLIKVLNVDVIEGEDDNDPVEVKVAYQYLGVRYDADVQVPTEGVEA
jgi:phage baseplate assembly protein W